MTTDPNTLLAAARCFRCIPNSRLKCVAIYLLEQWDNKATCDADALTFLTAAGIDPASTEGLAICDLVSDLKNNGSPAFWDSEILIYPFVGGTAASHSYNLKNPSTYQLTYSGATPPTHDSLGIKGTGGASGANTHYIPSIGPPVLNLNDSRVYSYIQVNDTTSGVYYYGVRVPTTTRLVLTRTTLPNMLSYVSSSGGFTNNFTALGGILCQRSSSILTTFAYNGGAFANSPIASVAVNTGYLSLLSNNTTSAPGYVPVNGSVSQLSGFSLGNRSLSIVEWPIYHGIWQAFQTKLSRQKP